MTRAVTDLLQVVPRLVADLRIVQRDAVQADDGVHRRTDFVAHAGKKRGLGAVRLLRQRKRVAERLLLV